jgi:uncharacterized protein (DUF4415 family)
MKKQPIGKIRRLKITPAIRKAYAERDKSQDFADPDAPVLPPEMWEGALIGGNFYRPLKTPVSFRIDNDVLAWLKSFGEGHLTRMNEILRERMLAELAHRRSHDRTSIKNSSTPATH